MQKIITYKYFQIAVVVFFAVVMVLYTVDKYNQRIAREKQEQIQLTLNATNPYNNLATVAKAYSVFDITQNKLISGKNEDKVLPLASITKIMTTFVALNVLNINDIVTINKQSLSVEGNSGFKEGQMFKLKDLIVATLVSSSNDGAYAIAMAGQNKISVLKDGDVSEFIKVMNDKATSIGMKNFHFDSVTGLDVAGQSTSDASAKDISILLGKAYMSYPGIYSFSSSPKVIISDTLGDQSQYNNTNELSGTIDGIIMSKTGYTDAAGGNLAVLYKAKNNHIISIVALGSTREERFSDVLNLIKTLEDYFVNEQNVIHSN